MTSACRSALARSVRPGAAPASDRSPAICRVDAGISNAFDCYVDGAVKRFQARHGLPADGVLGEFTLKAMNIPADVRLQQLNTNLVRLQTFRVTSAAAT